MLEAFPLQTRMDLSADQLSVAPFFKMDWNRTLPSQVIWSHTLSSALILRSSEWLESSLGKFSSLGLRSHSLKVRGAVKAAVCLVCSLAPRAGFFAGVS